jgi:hypothetical protein
MGLTTLIETWLIANALLLVWRILVTTDEMTARIGSIDYTTWVKPAPSGSR